MKDTKNISFDELRLLAEGKLPKVEADRLLASLEKDEINRQVYEGIIAFNGKETGSIEAFLKTSEEKLTNVQGIVPPKPIRSIKAIYWISTAAAVLILVIASYSLFDSDPSDYDFNDAGLAVTLSVNQENFTAAMNAYKLADYKLAVELIESELVENKNNDTLLYYKAVVLKKQEKYEEAIAAFNRIAKDSEFREKVDYQLAMSHWFMGNENLAKEWFKKISSNESHYFYTKASKALKELK